MSRADVDIECNLASYLGGRHPTGRYTSFDYCFNYFQVYREDDRLDELTRGDPLQLACLHLGFYLASWGMLRGSSELLRRSARTFVPVIQALVAAPNELWTTDANDYSEDRIQTIVNYAGTLRQALHSRASDILVTKIMLGTMGCVPAFDTNFKTGFGASGFGRRSLREVGKFYRNNAEVIDIHREQTLDFDTGAPTDRRYTRAKVIDMIFFIEGMR